MTRQRPRHFSRLKAENPSALSELSRKAATSPARAAKPRKAPGSPKRMTNRDWAIQLEKARLRTSAIMGNMELEGSLPDNPIAQQAMRAAIEMLAAGLSERDRLGVIRTLLEYNLARPPAAKAITVRSAEDILEILTAHKAAAGEDGR